MTMKCPKCGAEFMDGNKLCTDCNAPLIKKEEKKKEQIQYELETEGVDVVKLTSASDHVQAELLQGLLKNQGIPSYSMDKESGGYMRVYMGYSIFGEDIYVRASDLNAAQVCLEEWDSQRNQGEMQVEAEEESQAEFREESKAEPHEEWEGPAEQAIENEEEEKEIRGGNPLILQNRRLAAIILIVLIIIGAINIFPKL